MIKLETRMISRYEIDEDRFWTLYGLEFEDSMGVSLEAAGDDLKEEFITDFAWDIIPSFEQEWNAKEVYDTCTIEVNLV